MAQNAHVLIVPFPSQGHVRPLLKLAYKIADHGIKITFVNRESVQAKLVASSMNKEKVVSEKCSISFVTIPDSWKGAPGELKSNMMKVMPGFVEDLIKKERFSCVIADGSLGWILEVAERNGVNHAGFFPLAVGSVALATHIPELIKTSTIDSNGTMAEKDKIINLSPDIPSWKNTELTWNYPPLSSSIEIQKTMFDICLSLQQTVEQEKWIMCNTCYEIETAACNLIPKMLPVGPLIDFSSSQDIAGAGSFWSEDTSCFSWLDEKPAKSVIYIAFGSVAVISQDQFNELALGLELSGRPFLWAVRPNLANGATANYPDGFLERVADLGKIVEWAPQEKVLVHPSVACFMSHCGWNSTIEGLTMGIPFLCWPSFGDQFHNQDYITDIWKIGLKLNPDQNGIRNSLEIQIKVEILMSDDSFKANSERLKKIVRESVSKGGSSFRNFETFINYLKQ
ncbi:glycosyltransferase [Lithospermum erythrorhizon]|uniref:Glycosyltransferase n=1 Tax=Lithospermum erythrorhizon TaxID=34254 RepID=A0AAV3P7E9_LITER